MSKAKRWPPANPRQRALKMSSPWLALGSEHEVIITCTKEGPFKFFLHTKADAEKLKQITTRLNTVDLKRYKSSSHMGQWCVAPLREKLCRGTIVSAQNDRFTVYCLDYGETVDLPYSALYDLPASVRSPPLSRQFELSGIQQFKSSQEITHFFEELITGAQKLMIVIRPSPTACTQSCDLIVDNRINVMDQIRARFASYPTTTLNIGQHYYVNIVDVIEEYPWYCIIQLRDQQSKFQELTREVATYCNSVPGSNNFDPCIGSAVFVCQEDTSVRGRVVEKDPSGITVRLVDFCKDVKHSPSQLRPAAMSLVTKLPEQGFKCQLQSVADMMELYHTFKEYSRTKIWNMRVVGNPPNSNYIVRLYDDSANPWLDINMDLLMRTSEYQQSMQFATHGVPPGFQPRLQMPQSASNSLLGAPSPFLQPQFIHPSHQQQPANAVPRYVTSGIKLYRPLAEQLGQQCTALPPSYYSPRPLEVPQPLAMEAPQSTQWTPRAADTPVETTQQTGLEVPQLMSLETSHASASASPQAKQLTAEKPLVDESSDETPPRTLQMDREWRQRRSADRETGPKNDECWGVAKRVMSQLQKSTLNEGRPDNSRSNDRRDRRDEYCSNEGLGRDRRDQTRSNDQTWGRDRRDSDRSQNRDRNRSRDEAWGQERESGKKTYRDDAWGQDRGGARDGANARGTFRGEEHGKRDGGRDRNWGGRDRDRANNDFQVASNAQPEDSWDPVETAIQVLARPSSTVAAQPRVLEADEWTETPPVPKLSIPGLELTIGHTVQAVMVFLFNPHDFYMQVVCPELNAVMEQVETACAGQGARVSVAQLDKGDACLAQFSEDGVWYRAEVLSVSNGKAKVKFVDYGNQTEADETTLRQATEALTSLPGQAIYCKLRGSKPSQGDTWSAEELERFQALLEDQTVQVQLVALEGLQLSQFSVVLKKGDVCVNEQFGADPASLLPCTSLPVTRPVPGEQVFISWFLTPDNFHIKFQSLVDELGLMQREIQEMQCLAKLETVEEKSLVLAPKDSQYHRAQVLGIRGSRVRLSFLDQGFIQIVDVSRLRPCPESLCRAQRFSIPCRLEGVEPVAPDQTWPTCNAQINEVFQSSPSFNLTLVTEVDDQWSVELINNQGQSLASLLVATGLAKSTNVEEPEPMVAEEQLLQPGHTCSVVVNSCQDLGWFHLMRLADQDQLNTVQDTLNVREQLDLLSPIQAISGYVAAAKCAEDGQWYRGLIMSEATEEGVSVHYIDYGNFDVVPYVVQLPDELSAIPPLATKCCLPVSSPTSPEAIAKFIDMVHQESVSLVAHVLCELPDDCLCVDIAVSGTSVLELLSSETSSLLTEGYISAPTSPQEFYVQLRKHEVQIQELEEKLIEGGEWEVLDKVEKGVMCLAQFSEDGAWYRARVTLVTDSKVKVLFIDYGNCEEATQFRKLPQDLLDLEPLAVACSVEIEEPMEVQSFLELARDGTVLYQILLPENQTQSPLPVSLLKNGEDIVELVKPVRTTVKMSHFDSLGDFYVQLVSDEPIIATMSEKLECNETVTSVQEGDLVGAKFEDGAWYRARVMSESRVKFIDYGTEFDATEFKHMDEDLSSIPPLAYHCKFTKVKWLIESDKARVEQAMIDYSPFEAVIYKLTSKQQNLAIPVEWINDKKLFMDEESGSSQLSIHTRSKATSENESSTFYSTECDTESESTDVGNEHVINDTSSDYDDNDETLQPVLEEQCLAAKTSSNETVNAPEEMDLVSNPEKMESTSYNEDMDLVSDDVFESMTQSVSLVDKLRIHSVDLAAPPVTPETQKETELSSSLDEEALLKALDSINIQRDETDVSLDSDELETEPAENVVEESMEENIATQRLNEPDTVGSPAVTLAINIESSEEHQVPLTSPQTSEFDQAMLETIKQDLEELDELVDCMEPEESEQIESELPTEQEESELEFKIPASKTSEMQVVTEFAASHVDFVAPEQLSPIEGSEVHSLDSYAFNDRNDSDCEESNKENDPDFEKYKDTIVMEYNAACAGHSNEVLEIIETCASQNNEVLSKVVEMPSETLYVSTGQNNEVLVMPSEIEGACAAQNNEVPEKQSKGEGACAGHSKVPEVAKVVAMEEKMNEKLAAALSIGGYGQLKDRQKLTVESPVLEFDEEQLWMDSAEMQARLRAEEERRDRRVQEEAQKLFDKFLATAGSSPDWYDSVKPQWSNILAKTECVDPDEWDSIKCEIESLLDTLVNHSTRPQPDAMEMATLVPLPADEGDYDQVDSVPINLLAEELSQTLQLSKNESMQPLDSPMKESTQPLDSPMESIEPLESPKKVSDILKRKSSDLREMPVHLSPRSEKFMKRLDLTKKKSMEPLEGNWSPPKEKFMRRLELSDSMEHVEMSANLSLPLEESSMDLPANLSLPLEESMQVLDLPANLSLPLELSNVGDEVRCSTILKAGSSTDEPKVTRSCETTPKQVRSKVRDLVKAWEEQSPTKNENKPQFSPKH